MRYLIAATWLMALPLAAADVEWHADLGFSVNQLDVELDQRPESDLTRSDSYTSPHLGLGFYRVSSPGSAHWLGMRGEYDNLGGDALLGLRVIDYQYRLSDRFSLDAFGGGAMFRDGESAYGWLFGFGATYRELLPDIDLAVALRRGEGLNRDNSVTTEDSSENRDLFYDINSVAVIASWRFY